MLLQVCVNGARDVSAHPRLSAEPQAIAREAADAVAAGAQSIHVHPKDAEGRDSLAAADVARWVGAMRAACPGIPIGVTTGAWAAADARDRLGALAGWTALPDFASVNWHEEGAEDAAALLIRRGVDVEAGVWHAAAADAWSRSRLRQQCLRVLLELPDALDAHARVLAEDLLARVADAGVRVLLHGEERSTWPVFDLAVERGLDSRIGLEDCLSLPDGTRAEGNAALVRAARARSQ